MSKCLRDAQRKEFHFFPQAQKTLPSQVARGREITGEPTFRATAEGAASLDRDEMKGDQGAGDTPKTLTPADCKSSRGPATKGEESILSQAETAKEGEGERPLSAIAGSASSLK